MLMVFWTTYGSGLRAWRPSFEYDWRQAGEKNPALLPGACLCRYCLRRSTAVMMRCGSRAQILGARPNSHSRCYGLWRCRVNNQHAWIHAEQPVSTSGADVEKYLFSVRPKFQVENSCMSENHPITFVLHVFRIKMLLLTLPYT